jgi:hypothetical protein
MISSSIASYLCGVILQLPQHFPELNLGVRPQDKSSPRVRIGLINCSHAVISPWNHVTEAGSRAQPRLGDEKLH